MHLPAPNMQAVARADLKHPNATACCLFLESLLQEQLTAAQPNLAKLSIALGAVEDSLTSKKNAEQWPQHLPQLVEHNLAVLDGWIATLAGKLETLDGTRVSCSSSLHTRMAMMACLLLPNARQRLQKTRAEPTCRPSLFCRPR